MRELLYKEFRLAMHPVCYVFILLFPFMVFIPNYPLFISMIYVCTCYPILFLGANKGVQTNDLLFSILLPVRRKDIVAARLCVTSAMQFVNILLISLLSPLARIVHSRVDSQNIDINFTGNYQFISGFGFDELVFVFAFSLLGCCIYDFLFFILYYRNGKSVLLPTLLSLLVFVLFQLVFQIILPVSSAGYGDFFVNMLPIFRLIFALLTIVFYLISHYFIYRLSSKLLAKVNF